jgi:hypothetical protein
MDKDFLVAGIILPACDLTDRRDDKYRYILNHYFQILSSSRFGLITVFQSFCPLIIPSF